MKALLLMVLLQAVPPEGDDPLGRAVIAQDAGYAAFRRGDWAAAIREFQDAYRLVASPKALFNLARAYRAAQRLPEAYVTWGRFLAASEYLADPDIEKGAQEAQADRALLESQLGHVEIRISPKEASILVDDQIASAVTDSSGLLHLLPGQHTLTAELLGYESASAQIDLAPASRQTVVLTLHRIAKRPPVALPTTAARADLVSLAATAPLHEESRRPLLFAGVAVGAVAAALVVAIATGVIGGRTNDCGRDLGCF